MTLQDFIGTINQALLNFSQVILPLVLPPLAGVLVFLIGLVVAQLLVFTLNEVFKLLSVEKTLEKVTNYKNLAKADTSLTLTETFSRIVWWVTLVIFLVAGLDIAGYSNSFVVFERFKAFLPALTEGSLFIIIGILFSYLVSLLTMTLGTLSKFPATTLISKTLVAVIIIFSSLQALDSFGVNSETSRLLILVAIVASGLGFAFALKDQFVEIIKQLKSRKLFFN